AKRERGPVTPPPQPVRCSVSRERQPPPRAERGDRQGRRGPVQTGAGRDDRRRFDDAADVPPPGGPQSGGAHELAAYRERAAQPGWHAPAAAGRLGFREQNIILSAT